MQRSGLLAGIVLVSALWAQDSEESFFETKVRPVLVERCYQCHTDTNASGLRVDSRDSLLKGGSRGPALVPGSPETSLLVNALRHTGKLRMPPQEKIPAAEIAAIEKWVHEGAVWPAKTKAIAAKTRVITEEDKNFWSFRAVKKPEGSIDSIVGSRLARNNLKPNPRASDRALLRRLSFDLTGLPPAPEHAEKFLADNSPRSYEQLVDRLLSSPHFGERWGRHWLDVARYGEEDFTGTEPRYYPNAWRYRDWVVDAFNKDLPYDHFLKAQIAADLLPGDKSKLLPALGLFGLGPWYYSISQPQQARADEINDRIDMITRGFLGLTGACARCHDHKYDPITMRDYYALAGVFASSKYQEYPLVPPAEVERYKSAAARVKTQEKAIESFLKVQSDQLSEVLAYRIADAMMAVALGKSATDADLDEELLNRFKKYLEKPEEEFPYLREWHAAVARKAAEPELRKLATDFQRTVLEILTEKKKLDEENSVITAQARAKQRKMRKIVLPFDYDSDADFNPGADVPVRSLQRERILLWRRCFLGKNALLRFEGDTVERFLSGPWKRHVTELRTELARLKKETSDPYPLIQGIAEHEEPIDAPLKVRGNPFDEGEPVPRRFLTVLSRSEPIGLHQGSGRLQLADAIIGSPLSARVLANRIWLHLFGTGVVRTPSNFGRSGEAPANPELLEYLAARFVERKWSIKQLVREIVLSQTYQASTSGNAENEKIDPANTLFWRANRRRLDAEALRDSILASSGTLDGKIGGPSIALDEKMTQRTIYARISRFRQDQTLALFDFPSASVSSENRTSTIVPLQKLFFLNSPFILEQSKALAGRLQKAASTDSDRIRTAYQLLYTRPPDQREIDLGQQFLEREGTAGWERYTQVLLSSNEFAFVD